MKYIGIVGCRARDNKDTYLLIYKTFNTLYNSGDYIVSGGSPKGGDRFAEEIAKRYGIPILIFYPNWADHGKIAGFIRNTNIADTSNILIAAVHSSRTGGTEDTVKKFLEHNDKSMLYLV